MDGTEITVMATATILGPILAVQAQKFIERATERHRSRRSIFRALMSNRATRLNDDFVRSLNLIELEFSPGRFFGGAKDQTVINAWRSLHGEYGASGGKPEATNAELNTWVQRIDDRVVSLLLAMSEALGYDFSEEVLRRGMYYPKGRYDIEQSQIAILHSLRRLLDGKNAIPMAVTEIPSSPELVESQIAMMKKSANAYSDDGALRVQVVDPKGSP